MTPSLQQSAPLVKQLDRKHADYMLYQDQWEQLDLLYAGGVRLKNQAGTILIKRPKEIYDVFLERHRRFTYQNLLANCVGWYLAKLFAVEPKIDGKTTDDRFATFLQDSDKSGTTFMDFSRSVLETMMLYRRAFVLIDKPKPSSDQPIVTRADEQAQGLDQPYLVLYDPRQAFNWSLDSYGNVNWIVIKTLEIQQAAALGEMEQWAHWWVFDKTTFQHYRFKNPKPDSTATQVFFGSSNPDKSGEDAKAELVDQGAHALADQNRVPVRVCELPDSLWFANRAYLHLLEHVDVHNGYSWKLFMANHPQLVIKSEKELGGITRSEVGYIALDPKDDIFYLEPDGKSFEESRMQKDTIRQEIYRDFHLQAQGRDSSATADGASGYSKEMEMAPATDMLNAIGAKLRSSQQLILLDYKAAAKMKVEDPKDQPDVNGYRFENKPILQDINVAQALVDTGVVDKSPTLEKVVDKHIALSVSGGENEETKAQIIKELEEAPTRKEVKDQAQAQAQQNFEMKFQNASSKEMIKTIEGSENE